MSSSTPSQLPIQFIIEGDLTLFALQLRAAVRDLIEFWTEDGTPELIGRSAAYTLILRRDTLLISCAQVHVQPDRRFTGCCQVDVAFLGDSSVLALYCEFLHAMANGLPNTILPGQPGTPRHWLKDKATRCIESLPSPILNAADVLEDERRLITLYRTPQLTNQQRIEQMGISPSEFYRRIRLLVKQGKLAYLNSKRVQKRSKS